MPRRVHTRARFTTSATVSLLSPRSVCNFHRWSLWVYDRPAETQPCVCRYPRRASSIGHLARDDTAVVNLAFPDLVAGSPPTCVGTAAGVACRVWPASVHPASLASRLYAATLSH